MELHLFTVGAAVVANLARRGREDLRGVFSRWLSTPFDDVEGQERIEREAEVGGEIYRYVLGEVNGRPRELSAELNAFYGFLGLRGVSPDDIVVELFSTDTAVGMFCARVIREHLESRNFKTGSIVRVAGLGLGSMRFEEGLVNLLDVLASSVTRAKKRGWRVYVNATGGFKPETAYAVMSAFLFGADAAYYMHELFRDVVVIYPFPVAVDRELVSELRRVDGSSLESFSGIKHSKLGFLKLEDLEARGLVERSGGLVRVKRWVGELLRLLEEE